LWDVINKRATLIREPNEVRVLRLVRDSGQISRIEIAKACNLSKASVSDIVSRLIDTDFLIETGKASASGKGGRKRILLRFQPLAGLVGGIDIKMDHTTVAIADLNATIIGEETFTYTPGASPSEVIPRVISSLEKLIVNADLADTKLVGIGIGIPGLVDYTANTLIMADTMKGWQGADFVHQFESHFDVPVYLENDVKTITLGEYLFGVAKGVGNFVLIWIGDGIGAGIFVNGKLHRGITSSAGEIGYNDVGFAVRDKNDFPILFRNQKDFGDLLSHTNIISSYRRAKRIDPAAELTIDAILRAAEQGDATAVQLLDEFNSLVSIICINIINILNSEIIVLAGKIPRSCPSCISRVQEKIQTDILSVPAEVVRLKQASLGERATILGAVGLVLYELFEPLHSLSIRDRAKTGEPEFVSVEQL
jgi:N-acetylglucosamine repressor